MSPDRTQVVSGGAFSISVMVDSSSQVSSGDLSLSFSNTALEIVSIKPGKIFGDSPIVVTNNHDNSNGTAHLVVARTSGINSSVASNSLAIIEFKAKSQAEQGDYKFLTSKVGLADAKGLDIKVIQIKDATVIIVGQKTGDLDHSGIIDYRDLGIFGASYGTSKGQKDFNDAADLNSDGVIDYRDLGIFGANYGK